MYDVIKSEGLCSRATTPNGPFQIVVM